jgi:hypothetical protein
LDESLEGKPAEDFLGEMQKFFVTTNSYTEIVDTRLIHATDYLLRFLTVTKEANLGYHYEKLNNAYRRWFDYSKSMGAEITECPVDGGATLMAELGRLHFNLLQLVRGGRFIQNVDLLLLRLDTALLHYGTEVEQNKKQFYKIPSAVHHALRDFLNYLLIYHFDTEIPDSINRDELKDIKSLLRH